MAEDNPLAGQVVAARVRLGEPEDPVEFRSRLRRFCRERLPAYKVPARIVLVDAQQHGARFKTIRRSAGPDPSGQP
jgi:long-chain acyl-CoA synthetase